MKITANIMSYVVMTTEAIEELLKDAKGLTVLHNSAGLYIKTADKRTELRCNNQFIADFVPLNTGRKYTEEDGWGIPWDLNSNNLQQVATVTTDSKAEAIAAAKQNAKDTLSHE